MSVNFPHSPSHNMSIFRPSSRGSGEVGGWITWFLSLEGHEFFCRVPNDYITDRFHLTGLEMAVPNFNLTLDTILDPHFEGELWDQTVDTTHAENLYGLIHARYILTIPGMEAMCSKYERGDFGICPRVYCNGQNTLPVGLSDVCGQSHVKLFCPRCQDVFQPRSRCGILDGAMFGTSFPHMFFMQMPHLRPPPPDKKYVGRLYGFQLLHASPGPSDSPDRHSGFTALQQANSATSPKMKDSTRSSRRSLMNNLHFNT